MVLLFGLGVMQKGKKLVVNFKPGSFIEFIEDRDILHNKLKTGEILTAKQHWSDDRWISSEQYPNFGWPKTWFRLAKDLFNLKKEDVIEVIP